MESSIDPLRGDICASRNLYNDFCGRGGKIDPKRNEAEQ